MASQEKKSWANLVAHAANPFAEDEDSSGKHERSSSFTCASNFSRNTRRWGSRSPSPESHQPTSTGPKPKPTNLLPSSSCSCSSTSSGEPSASSVPLSSTLVETPSISPDTHPHSAALASLSPRAASSSNRDPTCFTFTAPSSSTPPIKSILTPEKHGLRKFVESDGDDSGSGASSFGRRMLDYFHSSLSSTLDLAHEACETTTDSERCSSLLQLLQDYTQKFQRLSDTMQPPVKTTSGGAEILLPKWEMKVPISSPSRLHSKLPPVEREILEQRIAEKQSKAEKLRGDRETQLMMKAQVRDTRIKEASNRVTEKLDRVRSSTANRHGKAELAREDHLNQIRTKASLETAKVKEVAFITSMTEIMKSNTLRQQLDQRLIEGEARHKQQLLLRQQPAQAATKWAEAVIDKRKAMDEEIKLKGTELDSKQKAAELRRQKIKACTQDDGPAVVTPEIRWCVICKVKLLTTEYVERHLAGKKHACELEAAGSTPPQMIVPFVEATVSEFMAPANMKAKKKKARKLKKLMVAEDKPSALVLEGVPNTPLKLLVEYLLKAQAAATATALSCLSDSEAEGADKSVTKHEDKKEDFKVSLKSLREILASLEQESAASGSSVQVYTALVDVLIPMMLSFDESSKPAPLTYKIVVLLCEKPEVCRHLVKERRTMIALVDTTKQRVNSWQALSELCCILRLILCAGGDSQSVSLTLRYIVLSGLLHALSELFVQVAMAAADTKDKAKKASKAPGTPKPRASAKLYLHMVQLLAVISGLPELVSGPGPVFETRTSDVGQVIVKVLKETSFAGLLSVMEALALRPSANRRVEHDETDLFDDLVVKTLEEALQTLNNIGRLDMLLLQRFASENQIQLYHIVGLLLRYCTEHFEDGSKALLHQLILFIGYCTLLNLPNQSAYRWGKAPILLQRLCNLPFVFFLHVEHRLVLLPTLIACCFRDEANLQILRSEINADHCVEFIKQAIKDEATCSTASNGSVFDFEQRFPRHLWPEAIEFLQPSNPPEGLLVAATTNSDPLTPG